MVVPKIEVKITITNMWMLFPQLQLLAKLCPNLQISLLRHLSAKQSSVTVFLNSKRLACSTPRKSAYSQPFFKPNDLNLLRTVRTNIFKIHQRPHKMLYRARTAQHCAAHKR